MLICATGRRKKLPGDLLDESELPSSPAERVTMMENLMTERATGGLRANTRVYEYLRREFMADPVTKDLLPDLYAQAGRSMRSGRGSKTKPEATQIAGG